MATTAKAIVVSARVALEGVTGIQDSNMIFSPREAPEKLQHRSFALSWRSRDTGKMRSDGRRRMHKEGILTVRVSHAMNTRDEIADYPQLLADCENIEAAVWSSQIAPLNGEAAVFANGISEPKPTSAREHVHTDIEFRISYVRDASTVTVP